jgi:hypothetical protein
VLHPNALTRDSRPNNLEGVLLGMTGYRLKVPERWFSEFCREFRRSERIQESELSLSGDSSKCSGWTAAIGVFLSRLAYQYGYKQDWEIGDGKIDFGWFRSSQSRPDVAIEHECWHTGVFGKRRRVVKKLVRSRCRLKVLITYGPGKSRDRWESRLQARITKLLPSNMKYPLLLVTANDDSPSGSYSHELRAAASWGGSEWYPVKNPLIRLRTHR